MAVSINDICENTKLAREMALMGNYESSTVYYQGVIQQIHRLLMTIEDPTRKSKWQSVQSEIAAEYEQVKGIVNTLQQFKIDANVDRSIRGTTFHIGATPFEEPTRDANAWFNNTLRDPDVWPPPPPRENDIWQSPISAEHRITRVSKNVGKRGETAKQGNKNQKANTAGGKKVETKSARGIKSAHKTDDKKDDKGEKCDKEKDEEVERRFDGTGYDSDLVDMLGKLIAIPSKIKNMN